MIFNGGLGGAQIGENGLDGFGPKELANVIKRMSHISVKIWRGRRLEKMRREALGPRISKCRKENVLKFK